MGIQVFYWVDPYNVQRQTENFWGAFIMHEKGFKEMGEQIQKWKDALMEASNKSGSDYMIIGPDDEVVEENDKDILKKLHDISLSSDFDYQDGQNSEFQRINSVLCTKLPDFLNCRSLWQGWCRELTFAIVRVFSTKL